MRMVTFDEISFVSGGNESRAGYQLPACSSGSFISSTVQGAVGGAIGGALGAGVGAVPGAIIGAVGGLAAQGLSCAASQIAEEVKPNSGW
ncbi:hypothetical protein [Arenimonas daejeonensis]|uniref:hypothetical protein n=1 Tax=Arenimonas daejeonensis TaxID=370777 RepID=UPI001D15D6D7|nr:hypothetical protein [Arenimonas daejeonensis]